ncbi:MAG: hypothetical protein K0R29_2017 [Pseudobdellovibrio sp.]|nr:hypothetical protein [Pseudobdellovibrio sp.]
MKNILFNKIILSIFFLLAGTAIAWTQGLVRYTDPNWQPRTAIVVNAKVKKINELKLRNVDELKLNLDELKLNTLDERLNKTETKFSNNSTAGTLDKIN